MSDYQKILVVIPSLDPDDRLPEVIRGVQEKGFTEILLVDDGSAPENQHYFEEGAAMGCEVLHHGVNKGKGRALKTAFAWFLKNRPDLDGCVTIDGDNQHHPEDIAACVDVMYRQKKDSLVLGVRDFNQDNVPPKSRFGNKCTSFVFRVFCGLKVSDTQTGLRVFPRSIIKQMLDIAGERFEYETNMLLSCKQAGIPLVEQTIRTIYIDSNATTHFHPIKDSLRVYGIIIKFFLSSLASWIIDIGLFTLFLFLFNKGASAGGMLSRFSGGKRRAISAGFARVISSIFNFSVNRKAVFHSKGSLALTMARYYILWAFQLLASIGLVELFSRLISEKQGIVTVIKLIVDLFLYFVSFRVQQAWVFREKPQSGKESS